MQRFAQGEAFDERAMPALDSEAIDFRVASELFGSVRRLGRRDQETRRLMGVAASNVLTKLWFSHFEEQLAAGALGETNIRHMTGGESGLIEGDH